MKTATSIVHAFAKVTVLVAVFGTLLAGATALQPAGVLAQTPTPPTATREPEEDKYRCNSSGTDQAAIRNCLKENPIFKTLNAVIAFLTAGVIILVIIMVAVGGIQYTSASDNAQQVQAAKDRIKNALLALLAYLFLYAFLEWLIPGGLIA